MCVCARACVQVGVVVVWVGEVAVKVRVIGECESDG